MKYYRYLVEELGFNVLAMAYRGFSASTRYYNPSEEGLKTDADAIINFLIDPRADMEKIYFGKIVDKINPELIFLQGQGLGGAVACYMAEKEPALFRGIILENTFTSVPDYVAEKYPSLPRWKDKLLRNNWDSSSIVPNISAPLLYIAGKEDERLPPSHS